MWSWVGHHFSRHRSVPWTPITAPIPGPAIQEITETRLWKLCQQNCAQTHSRRSFVRGEWPTISGRLNLQLCFHTPSGISGAPCPVHYCIHQVWKGLQWLFREREREIWHCQCRRAVSRPRACSVEAYLWRPRCSSTFRLLSRGSHGHLNGGTALYDFLFLLERVNGILIKLELRNYIILRYLIP